jgi:upstream activation factor subunit UAF30
MKDLPLESGLTKPMKLSDDLADIVGKKEASRAECVKELWAYVKKNDLQDPKNKQFFKPDKKLAKVFGTDRIRGFGMVKFLKTHLSEK